jgi:hypothetical protein
MMALSVIRRPGMKALWQSEISRFIRGLSLFTKHLEIILYRTLHKDIGLKFFRSSALLLLGISAIIVSFEPGGR